MPFPTLSSLAHDPTCLPRRHEPGFLLRIGFLGGLFVLELIAISIWLDAGVLSGRGGLTGLVSHWGARILQSIVASAMFLLAFGCWRATSAIQKLSRQPILTSIGWPWFAGHAAAMLVFAVLSARMFGGSAVGSPDWIAAAWLAAGVLGIVAAACAFLPVVVWRELFRDIGPIWAVAVATGTGVALFAHLGQQLWDAAENSRWCSHSCPNAI